VPGRLNKREVDLYYPSLVVRDGEYCRLCGQTPSELKVPKLEIHEIKYERPLRLDNFCLLCHGCNNLEILNRENIEGREPAPITLKLSRKIRPIFWEYVSNAMQKNLIDGVAFDVLVADATLYTGMVKKTIIDWLFPLYAGETSPYFLWGDRLYLRGREPRGKIQDLPKRDEELSEQNKNELK